MHDTSGQGDDPSPSGPPKILRPAFRQFQILAGNLGAEDIEEKFCGGTAGGKMDFFSPFVCILKMLRAF